MVVATFLLGKTKYLSEAKNGRKLCSGSAFRVHGGVQDLAEGMAYCCGSRSARLLVRIRKWKKGNVGIHLNPFFLLLYSFWSTSPWDDVSPCQCRCSCLNESSVDTTPLHIYTVHSLTSTPYTLCRVHNLIITPHMYTVHSLPSTPHMYTVHSLSSTAHTLYTVYNLISNPCLYTAHSLTSNPYMYTVHSLTSTPHMYTVPSLSSTTHTLYTVHNLISNPYMDTVQSPTINPACTQYTASLVRPV